LSVSNILNFPQAVQFANSVEASGRKFSVMEANRKTHLAQQYQFVFGRQTQQPHLAVISDLNECIYCNPEGVLLPSHSQLLQYGQKELTSAVKRQIGNVMIVDCSAMVLTETRQIISRLNKQFIGE
jgi:hypothetical protein